ncbi:hypothetical protein Q2T42_02700 [Leptolyngbya boryana CZ1]|uniref:Uncharacterized protein n=1 Tax=Leptolyngbya boryana CZ1 TaxID=3060204 RepID=A0AA97AQQ2_LEPBY|nr:MULTISPECIES: hypothetical protein [Leptolyngbya]MBD2366964.1 hypothetical protein [Leptolyngbya sp. FACHB-161]MBD2373682.1 hypothetical protein [Leptolyngbya sp. FACHB-238]MBD2398091.1 hypothetical protein [Leptolyngbya sp. FACHB-239]MBD2404593.1 hypothetical protein [Leptolyngbya sp. FACHB-402]MBN8563715.1 hypothetical protein [Leptolyngbya sp. UWPOB_LEPTO1]
MALSKVEFELEKMRSRIVFFSKIQVEVVKKERSYSTVRSLFTIYLLNLRR